ncbi:MAG: hypothetical protein IID61_11380 [SAR324 cluster bacterium]|nr:hypothetical protein [SAR324 cluster bacterium]
MKNLKTLAVIGAIAALFALGNQAFAAGGSIANGGTVSDSATVSLNVGLFAAIVGLGDFALQTSDADGSEGAVYGGSDSFTVKSNGAIHVTVAGSDLSKGLNSISTTYALDGSGAAFDTLSGVHNQAHTVSVSATLGDIDDQEAGQYSAGLTITVSAF